MFLPVLHTPNALELMDDARLNADELTKIEEALDTINYLSGSFFRVARWMHNSYSIAKASKEKFSFLDVGCGGGGLLRSLHSYATKNSLDIQFSGIDRNKTLLSIAQSKSSTTKIQYSSQDLQDNAELYSCIHSNLVMHHIPKEELSNFIRLARERATTAVRHEDLIRSRFGMFAATIVPPLITRSDIVHHDAKVSVARSYSEDEWHKIAHEGGYTAKKVFPERIQLNFEV